MQLFTKPQLEHLLRNGQPEKTGEDHQPVVKLFIPGTGCTWLLTELDPDAPDIAFRLCDLGLGFPELGYVSISEITAVRSRIGLWLERDRHFSAVQPISVYACAASYYSAIITDESIIAKYVR